MQLLMEEVPEGVEINRRENADAEYIFLQNFGRNAVSVKMPDLYESVFGNISGEMQPLETRILRRKKQ